MFAKRETARVRLQRLHQVVRKCGVPDMFVVAAFVAMHDFLNASGDHERAACFAEAHLQRVVCVLADAATHAAAVVRNDAAHHGAVNAARVRADLVLHWRLVLSVVVRQDLIDLSANQARFNRNAAPITLHATLFFLCTS